PSSRSSTHAYTLSLHDALPIYQRTIFSAGSEAHPATLSFLAPSFNESRDVNEVRLFAMQLIAQMANDLKAIIPDQVGRFDDSFRSEEHTSELQSREKLVCRLLL